MLVGLKTRVHLLAHPKEIKDRIFSARNSNVTGGGVGGGGGVLCQE